MRLEFNTNKGVLQFSIETEFSPLHSLPFISKIVKIRLICLQKSHYTWPGYLHKHRKNSESSQRSLEFALLEIFIRNVSLDFSDPLETGKSSQELGNRLNLYFFLIDLGEFLSFWGRKTYPDVPEPARNYLLYLPGKAAGNPERKIPSRFFQNIFINIGFIKSTLVP